MILIGGGRVFSNAGRVGAGAGRAARGLSGSRAAPPECTGRDGARATRLAQAPFSVSVREPES